MLDLPLSLGISFFVVSGFIAGAVYYLMDRYDWPFDWRGQWWLFAVWGIVWVVGVAFIIWEYFRDPIAVTNSFGGIVLVQLMTPQQALFDLVLMFTAALPGIVLWQTWGKREININVSSEISVAADEFVKIVQAADGAGRTISDTAIKVSDVILNNGTDPAPKIKTKDKKDGINYGN